mmetsp:Transcript_19866/g.54781  ORF Transcript_19866/g.54781 Transcript_19866/m.54781 type:complete len:724 (+) Transcript_19866:862-3033(+)
MLLPFRVSAHSDLLTRPLTCTVCQVPPTGNGHCDNFFNTPTFQFDGGDCCEQTCANAGSQCGVIMPEEQLPFHEGFRNCRDPSVVGHCVDDEPCYVLERPSLSSTTGSPFPVLSSNGLLMALGDFESVRVFERTGSGEWSQLGQTIQANFRSVQFASPPPSVVGHKVGRVPVYLAVSGGVYTRVFYFGPSSEEWEEESAVVEFDWWGLPRSVVGEEVVAMGVRYQDNRRDFRIVMTQGIEVEYPDDSLPRGQQLFTLYYLYEGFYSEWRKAARPQICKHATLSGDGVVFVTYSVESVFDVYVYPFIESVQHQFSAEDEVLGIQLDHYGRELTVISTSTDATRILRFDITYDSFDLKVESEDIVLSRMDTMNASNTSQLGVLFSDCGKTVALYSGACYGSNETCVEGDVTEGGLEVEIFTLDFEGFRHMLSFNFHSFEPMKPYLSVSDDANRIVGMDDQGAKTWESVRRCGNDEVALTVQSSYGEVSFTDTWSIIAEAYFPIAGEYVMDQVLYEMEEIIHDAESIFWDRRLSVTKDEFCLRRQLLDCTSFWMFNGEEDLEVSGTGKVLSLFDDGETTVTVPAKETGYPMTRQPLQSEKLQNSRCPNTVKTPLCDENESLFSLLLPAWLNDHENFRKLVQHPSWVLYNNETSEVLSKSYLRIPAGPMVAEQLCLDSSKCYSFSFSTMDLLVDPESQNFRAWWGEHEIFSGNTEALNHTWAFGECA